MDSPSGRPPGSFHWASTLWHEMSHVFVLRSHQTACRAGSPKAWRCTKRPPPRPIGATGWIPRPSTPSRTRSCCRCRTGPRLHPSQLSVAGDRVVFSGRQDLQLHRREMGLLQAARHDPLLREARIHARSHPEGTRACPPKEFDKQFLAWLERRPKSPSTTSTNGASSVKEHGRQTERAKKYDDVIREGNAIRDYIPTTWKPAASMNCWPTPTWPKATRQRRRRSWRNTARSAAADPLLVERLATLEEEAGEPEESRRHAGSSKLHLSRGSGAAQTIGRSMARTRQRPGAIREYQAVLALKPLDQATAHYQLARRFRMANRLDRGPRRSVARLEAAPGFKPAQKLLVRDCEINKHVQLSTPTRDQSIRRN